MAFLGGLFGGAGGAAGAAEGAGAAGAAGTAAAAAPASYGVLASDIAPATTAIDTSIAAGAAPMASAAYPGAESIVGGAGLPVDTGLSVPYASGLSPEAASSSSWLHTLGQGAKDIFSGYSGTGSKSDPGLAEKFGKTLQQLQQQGQSGATETQPPLLPPPTPTFPDPLTILQAFGIQS